MRLARSTGIDDARRTPHYWPIYSAMEAGTVLEVCSQIAHLTEKGDRNPVYACSRGGLTIRLLEIRSST